jgi:hypothetical protein
MVHADPFATVPHEPLTHGSPTQSVLVEHVLAQVVPPEAHLNGAQVTVVDLQTPAPSHVDPLTASLVAVEHEPLPQLVSFGQSAHWPLPSHLPSCPHVDASASTHDGWPLGGASP